MSLGVVFVTTVPAYGFVKFALIFLGFLAVSYEGTKSFFSLLLGLNSKSSSYSLIYGVDWCFPAEVIN